MLRYGVNDGGSLPKMNDELSSESENELTEYFGPVDYEPIEKDNNLADLGSLDVGSFKVEKGGHRF